MGNYTYDLAADRPKEFKVCQITFDPVPVSHNGVALVPARIALTGIVDLNLPEEIVKRLYNGESKVVPFFQNVEARDGITEPAKQLICFQIMDLV